MRDLLALDSIALGPSLSRSSLELSTSSTICNAYTRVFLKLLRNC